MRAILVAAAALLLATAVSAGGCNLDQPDNWLVFNQKRRCHWSDNATKSNCEMLCVNGTALPAGYNAWKLEVDHVSYKNATNPGCVLVSKFNSMEFSSTCSTRKDGGGKLRLTMGGACSQRADFWQYVLAVAPESDLFKEGKPNWLPADGHFEITVVPVVGNVC
jgi:hypothetical protein